MVLSVIKYIADKGLGNIVSIMFDFGSELSEHTYWVCYRTF